MGAQILMAISAFFICIGTSNAFVASLAQLGYSLSRDKAFPKSLSILHSSSVPRRMVIFVVCFAIVGVIFTGVFSATFNDLLFIPTSLGLVVYVLTMASSINLFQRGSKPLFDGFLHFYSCCHSFFRTVSSSTINCFNHLFLIHVNQQNFLAL